MDTQLVRSPAERERIQQGWIKWDGGFLNIHSGERIYGMAGGAAAPTNMFGGAHDVRDLAPNALVTAAGEARVADYLVQILEYYNDELSDIRSELVGDEIVEHKIGLEREAYGMYLQPADEYARPDAFRLGGRTWLYYPLTQYQTKTAWTRTYLARHTVGDLLRTQQALALMDVRTLSRDSVLALLRTETYTFDDEMHGPLSIVPFLNGDSFVPPPFQGVNFTAPHNHYMATNGALVAADFGTGRVHLQEHGWGTQIIAFCDPFLEDEIRALAEFRERADPTILMLNPAAATEFTNPAGLRNDAIGRIGQVQIVLKPWMPANYIFMFDETGPEPLLERVHELEEFRGFNLVTTETKFPLRGAFYERWTGFAVNNRINGFCIFVDAGATYLTPQVLIDATVV